MSNNHRLPTPPIQSPCFIIHLRPVMLRHEASTLTHHSWQPIAVYALPDSAIQVGLLRNWHNRLCSFRLKASSLSFLLGEKARRFGLAQTMSVRGNHGDCSEAFLTIFASFAKFPLPWRGVGVRPQTNIKKKRTQLFCCVLFLYTFIFN